MDTAVVVALITSFASILVALSTAAWTARENTRTTRLRYELDQKAKQEQRISEARSILNRYRGPLLAAADDLGNRINNIRREAFLSYLRAPNPRQDLALLGTLFRLAKYLGWIEVLNRELTYLVFEHEADTRAVADTLSKIGGTFATDSLDTTEGCLTSRFMLWREEQRAIGGLMRDTGEVPALLGFESFVGMFENRFSNWFNAFADDLRSEGVEHSERLKCLQELLAKLVVQLDDERVYTSVDKDRRITDPEWDQSG